MGVLLDIKQRCLAIEQAAIPGLTGKPYFMHQQSTYPYTTHRTAPITYNYGGAEPGSEELMTDAVQIAIVLVVGQITERYHGKSDEELDEYIEAFNVAFSSTKGRWLVSDAPYHKRPAYLYPPGIALVRCTGFDNLRNAGIPAQQVGAEILVNVPILRNVQLGG